MCSGSIDQHKLELTSTSHEWEIPVPLHQKGNLIELHSPVEILVDDVKWSIFMNSRLWKQEWEITPHSQLLSHYLQSKNTMLGS